MSGEENQYDSLKFTVHPWLQILEIEGVKYSFQLFQALGKCLPIGSIFRIVSRENDTLVIERLDEQSLKDLIGKGEKNGQAA